MWRRLTELLRWACAALVCASSATALAALVAEYKFEETSYSGAAGEVIDSSGNGYHGRMVRSSGSLAYPSSTASGKTCRGVQIPANTNSDIQAFDTGIDINTIGNRGTITFWYKSVNTGSTTDRALLDATSASGIVFNLNRHHHAPADLEARSTDDGGDTDYELGTNAVPEATWTHIALTWNGGGVMTIYANGVNEGTETIDAILHANTGTLYIGDNRSAFSPAMYSANGTIDQVRIYNSELSAAQINTDKAATPACSDLHHLELTTASSSVAAGTGLAFTIKACANAACSTLYTGGVTGNLSITGVTPTYTTGQAFSIAAGSSSTTETASMTAGTATASLASPSPTPVQTPTIYCGMGVAAASSNSCAITVNPPLHHLELTTASSTATAGNNVTFTVKACADASCSSLYTSGVTGTLAISGVTPTFPSGAAFTVAAGSATTTVTASTTAGTATASITSPSPTPTNSPALFCGMGVAAASGNSCNLTITPSLHHMEVSTTSNSGLTCTNPVTYTIKACGDAACSTLYTNGVTGNLSLTGATVNYTPGFTIASGSSSTTANAYITTAGTVTAALSGVIPSPSGSPTVYCGMGSSAASGASCAFTVADAGFHFTVPHHVTEVQQTITVSALRATGAPTVCAPLFTSSQAVNFKCTYLNPNSGAGRPVRVNGTALNAGGSLGASCDGTGRSITLPFNSSGVASPVTVQYADVGQVKLTASYSASSGNDSGLVMTGESTFIAAPASFSIGSITAAPIKAGSNFSATVTALNSAGSATPNFGREAAPEGATLTFAKYRPAGGAAGLFSGGAIAGSSFSGGAATHSAMSWTEVGTGDLTATLTSGSYLGSGMSATGTTGSTGAAGPFAPHHFSVSPSNACGAFTYSGQPFGMSITALNAAGDTTTNFDGSGTVLTGTYPQGVTLAATTNGGTGTLSNTTISGSSFTLGVAAVSASSTSPSFAFTTKQTVPTSVALQAADAFYTSITSSGYTEGSVALRSGRLKMSNAFGSEKTNLSLPVQAQYWGGNSWVINSADSCTVVPASAIGRSNYLNSRSEASSSWTTTASTLNISGGSGKLTLTAPSPSSATSLGSVDIAVNLGSTATDNACQSSHATTTGAAMSWLRATNANITAACPAGLIDPSARATFGVRAPHTHKIVHRRELF